MTKKLIIPKKILNEILNHCYRKINENFEREELKEKKAYGILIGKINHDIAKVEDIYILKKNGRYLENKKEIDKKVEKYGIKSETPFKERGWSVSKDEMENILKQCIKNNQEIIASYHMHRVKWEEDKKRDTPTLLDRELGKDSNIIMIIVSMVNLKNPIIRAYFEGKKEEEVKIEVK